MPARRASNCRPVGGKDGKPRTVYAWTGGEDGDEDGIDLASQAGSAAFQDLCWTGPISEELCHHSGDRRFGGLLIQLGEHAGEPSGRALGLSGHSKRRRELLGKNSRRLRRH